MKICIIGAMEIEIETLINDLKLQKNNKDIYTGEYKGKEIIVSKSGIGKVNSACNTQYLIDTYKPDYIINTGCCGALTDKVKIMDIIIPPYVTYHDFNPLRIMKMSTPDDGNIKADPYLIKIIENVIKEIPNTNYYIKPMASGDSFVTDSKIRDDIRKTTKAYGVDMESASIGHVCRLNNIPFLSIRTISDFSDGNDDFEKEAGYKSALIVQKLLDKIK